MSWINLTALWQIVVVGLLAGAGLPALFAVGLRALSIGGHRTQTADGGDADGGQLGGGSPVGKVLAGLCFLVVLAAVAYGIYLVISAS
jgi:hypothetical protein